MKNDKAHRPIHLLILSSGILCCSFLFYKCSTISSNENATKPQSSHLYNSNEPKQKGAHVFGHLDSINLQAFTKNNIEWITLVPFSSQKDINNSPVVYFRGDSLNISRRDSAYKNQIDLAHSNGFKVFLKPHIWLTKPSDGKWRSDIFPATEDDWRQWQKSYREFILLYAKIAQKNNVELFCIGTELTRLSTEKSDFWTDLIQEVRSIYSGKITYAANWYKEYEKITFWDELDYIGIQAYFPLVKSNNPNVQQISKGWNKYLSDMESISKKYNRKILFTELGYKSTADSAIEPWTWIDYEAEYQKPPSYETQKNCYEAFFNSVWGKDWFAGVHIWQMRSDFKKGRGFSDFDFIPQGKPAEAVIKNGFK